MTDWLPVIVILSVWPFEMIGTAYLVTWLLARKLGKIWKIEVKREKKWKLPWVRDG